MRSSAGRPAVASRCAAVTPGRMPVPAAGTVHRTPPASHTTLAVGASSAYPSIEVQRTSSAPCAAAQRRAARFAA
jgi:hypothetical protein